MNLTQEKAIGQARVLVSKIKVDKEQWFKWYQNAGETFGGGQSIESGWLLFWALSILPCVCLQLTRWTRRAPRWTPASTWRGSPAPRRRGSEWSVAVGPTPVENTCSDKGLVTLSSMERRWKLYRFLYEFLFSYCLWKPKFSQKLFICEILQYQNDLEFKMETASVDYLST